MNRNAIHTALKELYDGMASVVTFSDRLKGWSEVPPAEQPAVFLAKGDESIDEVKGQPSIVHLEYRLWIYTYGTDRSVSPAVQLNTILDEIQARTKPTVGHRQRLDGLVDHAWIAGSVETDEGTLGDQAVAVVPIRIQATT